MQYMIIYKQSVNTGAAYEKSNKDNNYNIDSLIEFLEKEDIIYD